MRQSRLFVLNVICLVSGEQLNDQHLNELAKGIPESRRLRVNELNIFEVNSPSKTAAGRQTKSARNAFFQARLTCKGVTSSCAKSDSGTCPIKETTTTELEVDGESWLDFFEQKLKEGFDLYFKDGTPLQETEYGVCAADVPLLSHNPLVQHCCCSKDEIMLAFNPQDSADVFCQESGSCSFTCCSTAQKVCGTNCCGADSSCGVTIDETATDRDCCVAHSDPDPLCCPWGIGMSCQLGGNCCLGFGNEKTCVASLSDCTATDVANWFEMHEWLFLAVVAALIFCCCRRCFCWRK